MEPPLKRRRRSGSGYPEVDLHARRAQNDFRLKSVFESIFDKYGKDFNGIGDEIDMETGEIVVNNGHILGMTNERDAGDGEFSSEEFDDDDDDEDEHSSIDYTEELVAARRPSKAGDAAVMEESEASEQSDFDFDSLMGDVPTESHLHQLGKKSRSAVSIPTDDEEDELASTDTEWASHSKDRLGAKERWCLLKDKPAFADEPAIEPAWRAPPLPKNALFEKEGEDVGPTNVDDMREYSDDERAGISLWTPEVKKCPRRRREKANSTHQQSLPFARGQENNAGGLCSDLSNSEPAARTIIKWTQEEEELLIHLKTNTNLSAPAMESYFPERQRQRQSNAIGSHWNYMVTNGKASPKPRVPTGLERRVPLPSLSPGIKSLASDGSRRNSQNHATLSRAKKMQTVHQQLNRGFHETGSLVRRSNRPLEQFGDHHINPQYQVGGDNGTTSGCTVDDPILISDGIGAHVEYIMGESLSSARGCETEKNITVDESLGGACEPSTRTTEDHHRFEKVHNRSEQTSICGDQEEMIRVKGTDPPQAFTGQTFDTAHHVNGGYESAYQANSNDFYVDTDQSNCLSQPLQTGDDVVMRREDYASTLPDHGLGAIAESGRGARVPSPTTSINAEPGFEGADPYSDGIVSPEIQIRSTAAMEASNSAQPPRIIHSASQQEESIPLTAEAIIQRKRSTEGRHKTGPMTLRSTTSAQPTDYGKPSASQEPNLEVTSKTFTRRQIVQVVVPLAVKSKVKKKNGGAKQSPLSHPHTRSSLATMETEDPALIRRLSATAESTPAALGTGLPNQDILVIRTPTRSPSVAAAESQYAASAAFVLDDVRSSLGPEIADSQPLSRIPTAATLAPQLGGEATKPIVLDTVSQSLRMTLGVVPSAWKLPRKATETINLDSDSEPLHVTPGIATPTRNRIEVATESDVVESGSNLLSKTLSAARLPLKKDQKEIIADPFSSIWTAIDDYSEDELSYL